MTLPVNDAVARRAFKYYIFDWDDNILHMPTRIELEHLEDDGTWRAVSVSTATFAVVRTDVAHYRPPRDGGWAAAFRNFADQPGRDAFLDDTVAALARVARGEKPGPSFNALRRTLREGRIFAIVTARAHSSATLERAVRLFIQSVLTDDERAEMMASLRGYRRHFDKVTTFGTDAEELDYYLAMCRYCAVTNLDFLARLRADPLYREKLAARDSTASELAKEFAIRDFVEHIYRTLRRTGGLGRAVSIGFSDDDRGNVRCVSDYIRRELSRRFEGIRFVVYDTSDRTLDKGRKVCVCGQQNLPGF